MLWSPTDCGVSECYGVLQTVVCLSVMESYRLWCVRVLWSPTDCGVSGCYREALAHLGLLHHGIKSSRSLLSCTRFETWHAYQLSSPTIRGFLRPVSGFIGICFPCRPRPHPSNCYLSSICLIRQCCLLHLKERHENIVGRVA